jgi:hypothetical protein
MAKKKAVEKSTKKPTKKSKRKSATTWAPAKPKPTKTIFQFRVTLLEIKPTIWRRIQIKDCFIFDLHWHIQGAFGWTNSHLHDFDIGRDRYGIPSEIDDPNYPECKDSTTTLLSDILPKNGKRFVFRYTYDFGDNWEHEVLFEGVVKPGPSTKYPVCIEGERAGPLESCGGTPGYEHLLGVLNDPENEEYDEILEWVGEGFDPERFDAKIATVRMFRGLRG